MNEMSIKLEKANLFLEGILRTLDRPVAESARQGPEPGAVVQVDQVRRLVRGQVVEHVGRREHQPP